MTMFFYVEAEPVCAALEQVLLIFPMLCDELALFFFFFFFWNA